MGQIIVRKYRNICYIRHSYYSSRYPCYNYALIHLNVQQKVSICTSSFWICLNIWICERKHPVDAKCAHILLPLVTLVTSTNKSVHWDMCIIREVGKNGKQYLNIVHVCLHFVQQKYMTIITTAIYMSCISKTACFSVNCAPLSLQFGWNEEPKGSNGSHPSEFSNRTPPSKLDMAPFLVRKASANQRLSHH